MAATSKTMAEVLAASPPMPMPMTPSNNNKHSGNSENNNTGIALADNSKENDSNNDSSNVMIKTFPYLTITVYIPTACVGVLIGKRGSNIDSIQKLASKESTKSHASSSSSSRGPRSSSSSNNKSNKQNKSNNQKAVSPESVRISVVNYPTPSTTNSQRPQNNFEQQQHYKNHIHNTLGIESGHSSSPSGQQQQQQQIGGPSSSSSSSPSIMDMGVPPTYTELDFSDPHWTPIVIRADPIAAIYAANAIHDICCPEYVTDRSQLVYIVDVPVPAVAATTTTAAANNSSNANANANLRHASIVGKRGNKLIQLSADHKCRIMVPPKQLGHNIIQLEAPLKECCSCLKAVLAKLQACGPASGNEENQQQGDSIKATLSSSQLPSKNAKNNATGKGTNNKNNKNDNAKNNNNCQMSLIIQPLPSQTKLRNIARKTETKILKKRIPKSQQQQLQRNQKQQSPQQQQQQQQPKQQQPKQELDHPESKTPSEQSLQEEGEACDQPQEKREQGTNSNKNSNTNESKVSWRLTVVANSEKKVMKAVDMLKVLNSKGYEVVVEELGTANNINIDVDTSAKTVSEVSLGGLEDDTDVVGTGIDSPTTNDGTLEGSKPAATSTNGNNNNNGRSGGRGGRHKKQRHRNNHRGNNGKDNTANGNSGKQQLQQQQVTATATATVTTTVGDS